MKMEMKKLLLSLTCLGMSFSVIASTQHVNSTKNHRYVKQNHANYKGEVEPDFMPSSNYPELIAALGVSGATVSNSHLQVTSSETDTLKQTNPNRLDSAIGQLGVGYVFYLVNGPRISEDAAGFQPSNQC